MRKFCNNLWYKFIFLCNTLALPLNKQKRVNDFCKNMIPRQIPHLKEIKDTVYSVFKWTSPNFKILGNILCYINKINQSTIKEIAFLFENKQKHILIFCNLTEFGILYLTRKSSHTAHSVTKFLLENPVFNYTLQTWICDDVDLYFWFPCLSLKVLIFPFTFFWFFSPYLPKNPLSMCLFS